MACFPLMLVLLLFSKTLADPHTICGPGNKKCYIFMPNLTDYSTAEHNCNQLFGQLTSIENAFEGILLNGIAFSLFDDLHSSDYWIGANYLNPFEHNWEWVDGTKWSYTNWAPGEPSVLKCAAVTKSTGQWRTYQPGEQKPSICDVAPYTTASCDDGWIMNTDTKSCYKTIYQVTFDDAESSCVAMGAHLTSIHSSAEDYFVSGLTSVGYYLSNMNEETWIGLQLRDGKWQWTDGTAFGFHKWYVNKPDNDGINNCAVMYSDDVNGDPNMWNNWGDYTCGKPMRAAICKKPVNIL